MNQDVIWCVLILIFLCIVGSIGCKLWLLAFPGLEAPFKESESETLEAFLAFWTYVIVLQVGYLVPQTAFLLVMWLILDYDPSIVVCNLGTMQNTTGVSHSSQRRPLRSSDG